MNATEKPTLPDLLATAAREAPDSLYASVDGEKRTYRELYEAACRRADALMALGCARDDKVGILLPNGLDYIELFFGAMMAGCIPVTINNRYKVAELRYVLSHADVKYLFTGAAAESDYLSVIHQALPDLNLATQEQDCADCPVLSHLFVLENPPHENLSAAAFDAYAAKPGSKSAYPQIGQDDVAFMMFTSGTTANPKACCLSHRSVVTNGIAQVNRWEMTATDRMYDPLPFFHMSTILPLTACAYSRSAFFGTRHFNTDEAVRTLYDEAITIGFIAFPTLTNEVINHPDFDGAKLPAMRLVNNAAPYSSLKLYDESFGAAVGVSAYGMTEAGGVIAYGGVHDSQEKRLTTCGQPFDGIEVRITDPDDCEAVLPLNQKGEIQIRGYCLFDGYYNDAAATRNAFAKDGWYRTGDLGILDADGYVAYAGRSKDMLKVGGENVAALEIVSHINTHPAVLLSQVIGVQDDRLDEVAAVFIELQDGATLTGQEVIDHCKGQISNFKIPRYVAFVTEWPMSATKVQKFKLHDLALGEKLVP